MADQVDQYDKIAATHPRIRRDVLFTGTPSGVLFHNAQGGFNLASKDGYRFASLIVPHLDGRNSVADLCRGLPDQQRRMVTQLVSALYERGFARDAAFATEPAEGPAPEVADRFAAQIGYLDHYAGDDGRCFRLFREARVAVLGDDPIARWCVLGLIRNGCAAVGLLAPGGPEGGVPEDIAQEARALAEAGCPVTLRALDAAPAPQQGLGWDGLEDYDTVVVTPGAGGTARLAHLLQAGIPEGRRLLGAWHFGRHTVIGPLMTAQSTGCLTCAALRLGAALDPGAAADLWSGIALNAPPSAAEPQPSRPLAAMIGNLLSYEVFRLTTGALPAETAGQVIIQDRESLDVVAEPLLAHPWCERCAPSGRPADEEQAVAEFTAACTAGPAAEAGLRTEPPASPAVLPSDEEAGTAALAELETAAVLVRPHCGVFTGFDDDEWHQTPLKISTVALGLGHRGRRRIAAFDIHHVAAARLRALLRAAEVYAEHTIAAGALTGAAQEAALRRWPAVAPALLSTSCAAPAEPQGAGPWVKAASLLDGETALVPAAALRTFGPGNHGGAFEPTSAGTGAGRSWSEAAARGLLTALSHDALRRAVRGTMPAALIAPGSLGEDREPAFLVRSAQNLGVEFDLLELGDAALGPVPVLLARCADPETGQRHWAAGSALSWRQAAVEAMRDLLGQVQLSRLPRPGVPVDTGDPLFAGFAADTLAAAEERPAPQAACATWSDALERLRKENRDALLTTASAPDLQAGRIRVVRVLLAEGAFRAR